MHPAYGGATVPLYGGIPRSAEIVVGEDGYIHGIDGMLNQVARAFVGQAMPVVQQDREMQARVGAAIGAELARPVWLLAGVAAAYVAWQIYQGAARR